MFLNTYDTDAYDTNAIETLAWQQGLETNRTDGILTVYFDNEDSRTNFHNSVPGPWETA